MVDLISNFTILKRIVGEMLLDSWIVDADKIDIEQTGPFRRALFHQSKEIAAFLELSSHRTIIAAPKGYGKTLLLKAKRASLPEDYDFYPSDLFVDKASGVPNVSRKVLGDLLAKPEYWKSLWLSSISLAILRESINIDELSVKFFDHSVMGIIKNDDLVTPCTIMANLINLSKKSVHTLENLYSLFLYPKILGVRRQTAVFIDNIDEFFDQELYRYIDDESNRSFYKSMWDSIQIGIALAARDIHLINPHIKIFASIRKEVMPDLLATTPQAIQIGGATIDLSYSNLELVDIIEKNIKNERSDRLFSVSTAYSVVERFFGIGKTSYVHPRTGDVEDVVSYFIRHTLGRPRDIAHIGYQLSVVDPVERTPRKIRDIINAEAATVASGYFTEMSPHMGRLSTAVLFPLIKKNYFTLEELSSLSRQYDKRIGLTARTSAHVFCGLYKLGFLGCVDRDIETGQLKQLFATPGSIALGAQNCLPDSLIYVIHPMLDDLIASKNKHYRGGMNKINVIGQKLPWRQTRNLMFVAKGDVQGFSAIMSDNDKYARFLDNFKGIAIEAVGNSFWKVEGGDSLLLLHENPLELINICTSINEQLREQFEHQICFGLDVGYIERKTNGELQGGALRRAARLEQAIKSEGLFLTEDYINEMKHLSILDETLKRLRPTDLRYLNATNGKFDLSKDGEEEIWTSIWRKMDC